MEHSDGTNATHTYGAQYLTCPQAKPRNTRGPVADPRPLPAREVENRRHIDTRGRIWEPDSLDTSELVMALEEEFGQEIPDGGKEKLQSVGM